MKLIDEIRLIEGGPGSGRYPAGSHMDNLTKDGGRAGGKLKGDLKLSTGVISTGKSGTDYEFGGGSASIAVRNGFGERIGSISHSEFEKAVSDKRIKISYSKPPSK